ncbi:DUF4136 domain-containing protein [Mucilaginibacter paludis]|uniref:DUF4136 domain-containing protein n=1 Tax=Mucilaginibacter paludis DSM 18603 TaxID=714943 RepID=H1YAN8_9SPHI|nr:hypothetical protein [Mucilaginibacter paludis]EHQ29158.1 hypothetical protein Mucpa_5080 [Mucilaginibacter paludis DSM 18603]
MKAIFQKSAICLVIATMLAACSTTTMVSSSWRKPAATANGFHHIFIAALTREVSTKQSIEVGLQSLLEQKGLKVTKSGDVFPPTFSTRSGQQRDLVLGKIQETNADGILTVNLLRRETETHYVPGSGYWNPGMRWGYYNRFWSYYNNWYPQVYNPGYYDQTKVYYIETNLYNAKTEELIWTAQSKTYDPSNIKSFLKGYIDAIYDRMVKDGLINAAPGQ